MQNFARMKVLIIGVAMAFPGAGGVAEAASVQQFAVGHGWDSGFAYGQVDPLGDLSFPWQPESATVDALQAEPLEDVLSRQVAPASKSATVPVPGSLVLFGSGLLMLAIVGRRRAPRRVF